MALAALADSQSTTCHPLQITTWAPFGSRTTARDPFPRAHRVYKQPYGGRGGCLVGWASWIPSSWPLLLYLRRSPALVQRDSRQRANCRRPPELVPPLSPTPSPSPPIHYLMLAGRGRASMLLERLSPPSPDLAWLACPAWFSRRSMSAGRSLLDIKGITSLP